MAGPGLSDIPRHPGGASHHPMLSRTALKTPTHCHRDGEHCLIPSIKTEDRHGNEPGADIPAHGKPKQVPATVYPPVLPDHPGTENLLPEIESVIDFELPASTRLHQPLVIQPDWWQRSQPENVQAGQAPFQTCTECFPTLLDVRQADPQDYNGPRDRHSHGNSRWPRPRRSSPWNPRC